MVQLSVTTLLCMRFLGYESCLADQDLWFKSEVNPSNGHKYYSYILLYIDDILCIHHDADTTIRRIGKYFHMKPDSIGDPDIYLGAKLRQTKLPNGVIAWVLSPNKYVHEAVKSVEQHLAKEYDGRELLKRASAPFQVNYRPELDITPELGPVQAQYYR